MVCIRVITVVIMFVIGLTTTKSFAEELKLEDLGFKNKDTLVDLEQDKILKKRESMLSTHQILGLTALALMSATYLTGEEGDELEGGKTQYGATSTHKNLGIASGIAYFSAAAFSILAPEPKNEKKSTGSSKWHKRLAWIHFPAMVLTTALGLIADNQFKKGYSAPTGILAQKPLIANIAFLSLLAAGITMTFDF